MFGQDGVSKVPEFLTDQHLLEYGAYVGTPSTEQLHKYFYLEESDLELISNLRYDHTRLGMAVQIGTLRYLGTFLERPTAVPEAVKTFVASQLKLRRSVDLEQYEKAKDAKYEHRALIRAHLGYKEFKGIEVLHLNRFLYSKALVADERPIVLFDLATQTPNFRQQCLGIDAVHDSVHHRYAHC